jgi:2'-5' RNA ligase
MGNESAIIIPVPEVEAIVGPLRLEYDGTAGLGVPAHITVLYPFCPPQSVGTEIETLREACRSIEMFPFSFTEVRRFPSTVYLHPDKSEVFVQITKTLARLWPQCKPYGGIHDEVIPHLTVADRVDVGSLVTVEDSLRPHLPLQCVAREIWLLISDHAGMWSRKTFFSLAAPK